MPGSNMSISQLITYFSTKRTILYDIYGTQNHKVKLPYMKAKLRQNFVAVAGGRILNYLPLDASKIESRTVFSFLNKHV